MSSSSTFVLVAVECRHNTRRVLDTVGDDLHELSYGIVLSDFTKAGP